MIQKSEEVVYIVELFLRIERFGDDVSQAGVDEALAGGFVPLPVVTSKLELEVVPQHLASCFPLRRKLHQRDRKGLNMFK